VRGIKQASHDALTAVVSPAVAGKIKSHFAEDSGSNDALDKALLQVLT
jgi:hypothetical protein